MKIKKTILMLALFWFAIFIIGCTRTIHETPATDSDTGDITRFKVDGRQVKVVHSF